MPFFISGGNTKGGYCYCKNSDWSAHTSRLFEVSTFCQIDFPGSGDCFASYDDSHPTGILCRLIWITVCNIHMVHFHSTQIIFRSTMCTDPGVSYRNYLGMCNFVRETAHGYVILRGSSWLLTWRKQRKRSVMRNKGHVFGVWTFRNSKNTLLGTSPET